VTGRLPVKKRTARGNTAYSHCAASITFSVRTNPGSVIGAGLGVFGLRDLGAGTVATTLRHMLRAGGDPHGRNVLRQDVVGHVRVRAAEPVALQVDGEHLGSHRDVRFRAVTGALRVVV